MAYTFLSFYLMIIDSSNAWIEVRDANANRIMMIGRGDRGFVILEFGDVI
jgi:hypothetical protein